MRETPSPRSHLQDRSPDLGRSCADPFAEALERAEQEADAREQVVRHMADKLRREAQARGEQCS